MRFWPVSRESFPKQFVDILGVGKSLIRQTFDRFTQFCPAENIYVITNTSYKSIVKEQIPQMKEEQILCEPYRKNTAPCIAYANYKIQKKNPNAVVVVAPSDHIILREDKFIELLSQAYTSAKENPNLLTLGIKPSYPNTGYGYIQFDDSKRDPNNSNIRKVKLFTEKPQYEMAKQFVASGEFLWNSGIFIWSLKSIMQAFKENLPEVDEVFANYAHLLDTEKEAEAVEKMYLESKSISIDYGVMEKAQNVSVLECDFGWSDVGTWNSLYELQSKNEEGNAIVGDNVICYQTRDSLVRVPKEKLVILQGLEGYIVVEDNDTLLICKREEEQMLRQIVADVKEKKGEKYI